LGGVVFSSAHCHANSSPRFITLSFIEPPTTTFCLF
jgi:hypothetical protein